MKKLFLAILLVLIAASFVTVWTSSAQQSDVPVISWRTDANPQRFEQIDLFKKWLVKQGKVLKDAAGNPVAYTQEEADAANLAGKYFRTDAKGEPVCYTVEEAEEYNARHGYSASDPNRLQGGRSFKTDHPLAIRAGELKPAYAVSLDLADNQSTLIQAVSGMAGDVFDTSDVVGYQSLGVGVDVTEAARKHGFSPRETYAGILNEITRDGVQYAYPANSACYAMWINLDTVRERAGMTADDLPEVWTPDEFEAIGKRYIDLANRDASGNPLARQEYFFCQGLSSNMLFVITMIRSEGFDVYNETLTRSTADNPAVRNTFARIKKWTYEDHLLPTAAELASMNSDSGYGGVDFSNLLSGKYAMISIGRYCLIRFREFEKKINFAVSQFPQWEFKSQPLTCRAAMPYAGSSNPEALELFLAFLASYDYNKYIIDGSDGIPPNPHVVRDEVVKIKEQYPNEGTAHEREFKYATTIGLPLYRSPYVKTGSTDWLASALDRYLNDRATLDEAVASVESRFNQEIENSKDANPRVRQDWEKYWALQQQIDRLKAEGKPIPAEWIRNPFHLAYYRSKGMLLEGKGDK